MEKFNLFRSADDTSGADGNKLNDASNTDASTANASASDSGKPENENKQDDTKDEGNQAVDSKKYTDEDISKLKAEFDQKIKEATALAEQEANKKASMKPEEKAEYEQTQKLAEIQRREQEAAQRELRLDTLEILESKQLPKEFVDYVLGADKETTIKRIESFKPLFDKAVQAQVETRLKGKMPEGGNGSGSTKTENQSVIDEFAKAMGRF